MNYLRNLCTYKPFTMVLEGVVDSQMDKTDFTDLCCSIADSLDFCICYTKTITEIRQFHIPGSQESSRFSFHVTFPEDRGNIHANKKFVEDKMVQLLEVVLKDSLPVGYEGGDDYTAYKGKTTFAIIKVPV